MFSFVLGASDVRRKVNFGHLLANAGTLCPGEFDFVPASWALPQQYDSFRRHVQQQQTTESRCHTYIVKPDCGHVANGIYLIQKPEDYVFNSEQHIVQEYIEDPLVVDNFKFDFRIYAVVTSLEPPEFYLYNEGQARFCTVSYQRPHSDNISETFMHVTNGHFNKANPEYEYSPLDMQGSKRSMSSVFDRLRLMGHDVRRIKDDIRMLVLKTLLVMAPEMRVEYRVQLHNHKSGPECFQVNIIIYI